MSNELWAALAAVDEVSRGFAQKAVRLARERGLTPCALMVGDSVDGAARRMLSGAGMEKLYLLAADGNDVNAENAIADAISALAEKLDPAVLLFECSLLFGAVAPAVAVKLDCGITADCTELRWDECFGLLQIRPTFGGRKLAVNRSLRTPCLATVRRGIFPPENAEIAAGELEVVLIDTAKAAPRLRVLQRLEDELTESDLVGARIILSGGLGMGSRESFARLFILGRRLGAAVGASRAAVAAGYATYNLQVGQTGVTVRPELYVAFGISGAVQHLSGMMDSGKIIAVNSDPAAPIHRYSDHSVLADCNEVIDYLINNTTERVYDNGCIQ